MGDSEGQLRMISEPSRWPVNSSSRLDTGSVGSAVLPNGRDLAYLQGLGDPPF